MVENVAPPEGASNALEPSDDLTTHAVGPIYEPRKLRDWALVLASMNIAYAVRAVPGEHRAYIVVGASDRPRAVRAIQLYEAENRDWPPRPERERLPYARTLVAPLLMSLLVVFFAVTGPASAGSPWFSHGTASSERILHGELWRTVTALTLHADTLHVMGNALSGSIFLSAVNRRLGDGRGPLLVLVAGAAGNLLNALWYHAGHLSIGASTAVFSAVGILAATSSPSIAGTSDDGGSNGRPPWWAVSRCWALWVQARTATCSPICSVSWQGSSSASARPGRSSGNRVEAVGCKRFARPPRR